MIDTELGERHCYADASRTSADNEHVMIDTCPGLQCRRDVTSHVSTLTQRCGDDGRVCEVTDDVQARNARLVMLV